MSAIVLFIMLFSAIPAITLHASSDPGYVDNGDFTKSVIWNFTDPSSYTLSNTTVSGGLGMLEFVNETALENSTSQYMLGTRTNVDVQDVQDAIVIDNTSLTVQTLTLQPGPEGIDCYLDEWFPGWNPDTLDLDLSPEYDPNPLTSKRSRIVMQFDLSSVPAGATIVNATLLLYEKAGKSGMVFYSIHALNHSFNEQTASWRTGWMENGGDFSVESFSNGSVDATNGWHPFDMTRLVDLWTRGAVPNYGFIINPRNDNFDAVKTFTDSDNTNKPEQRPQLVVNYALAGLTGSYQSSPLGPGTNATFTSANWTEGFISKVTDEFTEDSLASKWEWTNDPALEGGSVNFDRLGWLNITGSQPTDLVNISIGSNYMHQNISGDFRAETSLQEYFSADSMGAGLLVKSDDLTWLALYKTGVQGAGQVVAKSCKGGYFSTIGFAPWTTATAFLRIDRVNGTYQFLVAPDGINWSVVASYTPLYDLTHRASIGLFVSSGMSLSSPVVEFDFLRAQPVGQSTTLEMRVRTGNSTNMADPSWDPWGAPVGPNTSTVIGLTSKYVQYQVTLITGWEWLSPAFYGFTCHDERFLPDGVITTEAVYQVDLSIWDTMTVIQSISRGSIEFFYSSNGGGTWQSLGYGSSFSLAITEPSMMLRMVIQTNDTLVTPTIDTIELRYSVSIASFHITTPGTVVAGQEFSITIEARDPSNNLATGWNGTVTLHALNAAGTMDASDELHVTSIYVPPGGLVVLTNQTYDFAETIMIIVSAGTVRGISAAIVVESGPATTLTMEPGNTTMFAYTSLGFTATASDALGNVNTSGIYAWTVQASLGMINTSVGRVVLLTVGDYYTGGYLNVSYSGLTVSRWIDVLPERFPPSFTSPLPDQTRPEDSGEWTLDITSFVSDPEDPVSKLRWYTTHESIVGVRGENRTGNLVITLTTLQDVSGSADVNVFVVDSDGMKATTTLHVVIEPENDPPSIDPIDPFTVQHDVSYLFNFEYYIHDTDNSLSELTLSVDGAMDPYTTIDDKFISFKFPESLLGTTQMVIVTVTDTEGASSATAVLVEVGDGRVPSQVSMLPDIELDQGETIEDAAYLPEYFYDPDDALLTYDWECEHSTIVIKLDGHIDVTAPDDWYGSEYAIIRAIDSQGARVEGIMQIVVRQVNHPSVLNQVPDLMVHYDQRFDFDVAPYVSDADEYPEDLIFTTNDLHCSFTGTLMSIFYPLGMNNTVNPVTITVVDGAYSSSCTINITVSSNYPPERFAGRWLPDHLFQEDNPIRYPMEHELEYYFWDQEDGQTLSFIALSLTSNVSAVAFKTDLGVWKVELNTTKDYNGMSELVIRAIDSSGAISEQTVTLEVASVPDAPVLDLPSTFSVIEGQQMILSLGDCITDPDSSIHDGDFTFTVQIVSAEGQAEEYLEGISTLPGMLLFKYPSGFLADHDDTFTIEVVATDQDGKVGRGEIEITVSKASNGGQDPLMLTAAILATIGGVSGMGAIAYVRRKKPFVIRDVMLIHNDGFLIGRYADQAQAKAEIDQDVLSGMMTAVLNFVEDSMSTSHESLKTFGFKDYQVLVQRGTKSFAAVVYEGDLPTDTEKWTGEFLGTFERVYKKKITAWTGDIETDFAGVELLIQSYVKEHSKRAHKKSTMPWAAKR